MLFLDACVRLTMAKLLLMLWGYGFMLPLLLAIPGKELA